MRSLKQKLRSSLKLLDFGFRAEILFLQKAVKTRTPFNRNHADSLVPAVEPGF